MALGAAATNIPDESRYWMERLPLYAASLVVTLAGVGAVGVTVSSPNWMAVWATLTLAGHIVSFLLRRLRVSPEQVFFPVMLLGCAVSFQQLMAGTQFSGLDGPISTLSTDMATAVVVGALAVVRCFTLVTDTSLLFSPVPAITMLALVGSTNPNAEVPLFFGLVLLGSLFICGYEAHLRRGDRVRRNAGLVTYYLLVAWAMTLGVALVALAAPVVVQPVTSQFSPYALPAVSRMKMMMNFTQATQNQAPVGQGPITLSPTPLFEVYSPEGGRLRTSVFTTYTGREWTTDRQPETIDIRSEGSYMIPPEPRSGLDYGLPAGRMFRFPRDPEVEPDVRTHRVFQRIVVKNSVTPPIPALGRVRELHYPGDMVTLDANGCISGTRHLSAGRMFEVVSEVPDYTPERLRQSPPVDLETFNEPEALQLPQSSREVQALARRITARHPAAYDKIDAIISYIERNCRYSLVEDVTPMGEDAAAHYLFNSHRGACDLAATAAAVMCRSVGIPARVAVGYVAAEDLPQGGGYLVRGEHAHMWLEAYFPGCGWAPFDPAPPLASIKDRPLDMVWYRLHELFSKVGGGGMDAALLILVIGLTLGMAGYVGFTAWRPRARAARAATISRAGGETARIYGRSLALLERRGWRREPWMTPEEFLQSCRAAWTGNEEAQEALAALTEAFQRAYYGEAEPGETRVDEYARAAARKLEVAAPHRPKSERGRGKPAKSTAPEAV